jgi:hypothetical protein
MPSGPKGAKRPRDPAQLAKLIVDIATGEVEDREPTPEEQGKDPAAAHRIALCHPDRDSPNDKRPRVPFNWSVRIKHKIPPS